MADYIITIEGDRIVKATEIVRCEDCFYFRKVCVLHFEREHGKWLEPNADDSCKWGERRDRR